MRTFRGGTRKGIVVLAALALLAVYPGVSTGSSGPNSVDSALKISRQRVEARDRVGRRHRAGYDRSVRRWRHVDLGHHTVHVEAEVRRVDCAGCVRLDGVTSALSAIFVNARGERTIATYRDHRLDAVTPRDADALAASADAVLADNRFPTFSLPICRSVS